MNNNYEASARSRPCDAGLAEGVLAGQRHRRARVRVEALEAHGALHGQQREHSSHSARQVGHPKLGEEAETVGHARRNPAPPGSTSTRLDTCRKAALNSQLIVAPCLRNVNQ